MYFYRSSQKLFTIRRQEVKSTLMFSSRILEKCIYLKKNPKILPSCSKQFENIVKKLLRIENKLLKKKKITRKDQKLLHVLVVSSSVHLQRLTTLAIKYCEMTSFTSHQQDNDRQLAELLVRQKRPKRPVEKWKLFKQAFVLEQLRMGERWFIQVILSRE